MFGLGFGEILLLSAIGLIVLGPKQMPQVARVIGRTIAELRKALHEVTSSVSVSLNDETKKNPPVKKPFEVKEIPPHPPNSGNVFDKINSVLDKIPGGTTTVESKKEEPTQPNVTKPDPTKKDPS